MADATSLRNRLRQQRQALSREQQTRVAEALLRHWQAEPRLQFPQRVALYLPVRGEADPGWIQQTLLEQGKAVYLPRLQGEQLQFARFQAGDTLPSNRFDIPEPAADADIIATTALDLVLLPLLAFDDQGRRLGMGAGFYDRAFAFRQGQAAPPLLVGVAHAFQQVEALQAQPWDVNLDAVLTENGLRFFSGL